MRKCANSFRVCLPEEILQAFAGGPGEATVPFGNLIQDGYVIPGELLSLIRSGRYERVPIILGSNRSESGSVNVMCESLYEGMPNYRALLSVIRGEKKFADVLVTDHDKELWKKARDYGSLFWRAIMVDEVARSMAVSDNDIFVYRFDWGENEVCPPDVEAIYGAPHAIEIPFFHACTDRKAELTGDSLVFSMFTESNRQGRSALSEAMVCYLAQFALTGNPNRSDTQLPRWQPWSQYAGGPKSIVFDADMKKSRIRMEQDEVSVAGIRYKLDQESAATRNHVMTVLSALHPFMAYDYGNYEYTSE